MRKLFANEQELERLFILYGNTTDCYFNGAQEPYLSFEPMLESHLDSIGYERVIFYSGKDVLKCYRKNQAAELKKLLDSGNQQENSDRQTPHTDRAAVRMPSMFKAAGVQVPQAENSSSYSFSTKTEKVTALLDKAMKDKEIRTCVVFTNCWTMLDMQTDPERKEEMADVINGWYGLSTNNHNIAIFLFGEPRLESLASFLRNKSAWAFLYERMFSNDLPTEAIIRIGPPQRDEIYAQLCDKLGKLHDESYNSTVEKAALTLVQKQGGKLLALRRYLEHVMAENRIGGDKRPTTEQQQTVIDRLLKDFGDSEDIDAVQKINETEGWQEIAQMVNRLVEEAQALPKNEQSIHDIGQELDGSSLRLSFLEKTDSQGVNMTIMLKGAPGTGKTTAAHWIGEALRQKGLLPVGRVITATKDQLEAGYVGQSAIKTREKINEAIGNVLFIDEAYSLFRKEDEGRASFGREVIDTLVEAMTSRRGELAFILAGYPEQMDHFLTANPGLSRRFGDNIVTIREYSVETLERIALQALRNDSDEGVSLDASREARIQTNRHNYLLDTDLIYSEGERNADSSLQPLTPEEATDKIRQAREEGKELSPFSIFFDNWYADRDPVTFGNAGAALQIANSLRLSARKRAKLEEKNQNTPVLITRKDFPEDKQHLFERRKPSLDEVDNQMKDVIGMQQVRLTLERVVSYMRMIMLQNAVMPDRQRRIEPGHYLFVGNPGTGKTMISEKLALALSGLGIIGRYKPVRITGMELSNMLTSSQGIDKVKEFIQSCKGGVLVIDEAHQLVDNYQLGQLTVKALLDPMITMKYEMSFVFCCYPEYEKRLLDMEPGLARRISDIIRFEDYTPEEILQIFQIMAKKENYRMNDSVTATVQKAIEDLTQKENQNGGTAEKLFREMKISLSERLMAEYKNTKALQQEIANHPDILFTFTEADAEAGKKQVMNRL